MISFSQFNSFFTNTTPFVVDHNPNLGVRPIFGMMFKEDALSRHALTISCMKQLINDNVAPIKTNYNETAWGLSTQLNAFALLANIVRYIIINEQKHIKEMEVVGSAGNPNDVVDDEDDESDSDEDEDDEEDEDEDEDEDESDDDDNKDKMFDWDDLMEVDPIIETQDVNSFEIPRPNVRVNQNSYTGTMTFNGEEEEEDVVMGENDSLAMDRQIFIKDSLMKYKNNLMREESIMSGDIDMRENNTEERLKVNSDNVKEYVYIIRKKGFVILILSLTNHLLTYSKINEVFQQFYKALSTSNDKKGGGRTNREQIERFTHGMKISDLQKSYRVLMKHIGLKKEFNTTITSITQMFKISNIYNGLLCNNEYDLVQNMFFKSNYRMVKNEFVEILTKFANDLNKRNHVYYMNLGTQTHLIPIDEFDYEGVERRLLPWLDKDLCNFFLNSNESPESSYTESYLSKINSDLFQKNTLKMMSDPLEYLESFIKNFKRENDGKLTIEQKKFLCRLLGYVIENPKLQSKYSEYNKAFIRRINEIVIPYGKFYLFGEVLKISEHSDIPLMKLCENSIFPVLRKKATFGPLSELLWFSANILREYHTMPREYLSHVGITPLIIGANCNDRTSGHHMHIQTVGLAESGKDALNDVIRSLLPDKVALSINSFSDQAFSTDEPQNGGVVIMNDPNPILSEKESKLGFAGKKKLSELKGMFSTGEFIRLVNDYITAPGKKAKRGMKISITPVCLCFLTSINHIRNRGEALWTRFMYKSVFKYKNSKIVKNMIKRNEISELSDLLKKNYHNIIMLQKIVTIAISAGIIEEPTIGIAADMIRIVLNELKFDGLTNTESPRNFGRILMVIKQLIYASAIIKKYLQNGMSKVKVFEYEDLVELEKDLSLTTEVLFISTNYLIEQWANPVTSIFVSTFLKRFSRFDKSKFILNEDEVRQVDTYLQQVDSNNNNNNDNNNNNNDNDNNRKKKRRKINDSWNSSQNIDSLFSSTTNIQTSTKKIEKKKRKRRLRPSLSTRKKKKTRKRKREEEEEEGNNSAECLDMTFDEVVESTRNRKKQFELAIRRLDKLIPEIIEKRAAFGYFESDSNNGERMYDLNCISIETSVNPKKIVKNVFHAMPVVPTEDDVYNVFDELREPKHCVPIWFDPISGLTRNKIMALYRTTGQGGGGGRNVNSVTKNQRIGLLRDIFKNKCKYNVLKALIKVIPPDDNSPKKITKMIITPSLLNIIDPTRVNKRLITKIENISTIPKRIFCPKLTMNPTNTSSINDFEFIDIKKNTNVGGFKFYNPAYIKEEIAISCMKTNQLLSNRIKSVTRNNLNFFESESESGYTSDESNSSNDYEIKKIEDHPDYLKELELYKDETIIIKGDLDEYLKRQRKKYLELKIKSS